MPGEGFRQDQDTENHADHGGHVGHGGRSGRAPGPQYIDIPDVRDAGTQHAEGQKARHDWDAERHRVPRQNRREQQHDEPRDADVQEGKSSASDGPTAEKAPRITKREAVAHGRAEAGQLPPQIARESGVLPGADDDDDTDYAEHNAHDLRPHQLFDSKREGRHEHRHNRRYRVVNARKARRDELLGPRKKQVWNYAAGDSNDQEMKPDHAIPGQHGPVVHAGPAHHHDQPEGQPAEHEPGPGNLAKTYAVEGNFHEQKARTPDKSHTEKLQRDDGLIGGRRVRHVQSL